MKTKLPAKHCESCLNFERSEEFDMDGICSRYPEWVDVETYHHCGEFSYNLDIQKNIADNRKASSYKFEDMHLEG